MLICLEFSITRRIWTKWNNNFYFLSHPSPTYFGLKRIHNSISIFLEFFCYFFFLIFSYASGRNETERSFLFSLFHILFHPILVWNLAITVLFYISNFFYIFLKFCISSRVGAKQNDNFYFDTFSAFSNLFGLETKP